MFGTPYQGRLAHFPPPPQPSSQPLSPTVAAQRLVREEQDAAYQASLLVSCLPDSRSSCFSRIVVIGKRRSGKPSHEQSGI